MEIWKELKGYEGFYEISNYGIIKSVSHLVKANKDGGVRYTTPRTLKFTNGWHDYLSVNLFKNGKGKTFYVHRLVAENFISNPENKPQVNHIDGNKHNNCVDNLEWCSDSENLIHALNHDLLKNNKPVKCIETGIIYKSSGEAERKTGTSARTIRNVCAGKGYTAGKLHWEFA